MNTNKHRHVGVSGGQKRKTSKNMSNDVGY